MQKKFYTAKNDAMVKAIFCNPKNTNLLKSLIEKCLNIEVKIIEIKSPAIIKENIYEKGKVLDVLVYADDRLINIEMNSNYYSGLSNKNSAYIFNKYTNRVRTGERYKNMPDVIQIEFTSGLPKYYPILGRYQYIDPDTRILKAEGLITYEYNIDKIKKICYNGNRKYDFIAALDFDLNEIKKYCGDDNYMEKFSNELKKLNEDVEFTEFLSAEEDAIKTQNTLIYNAKEEGLKQGEKEKAIQIAKNLLGLQMKPSDIANATGLSEKEVAKLEASL